MAVDRDTFLARLVAACGRAVEFSRIFAVQHVPSAYELLVVPNSSCDAKLVEGEVVFPEESLPEGQHLGPMSSAEFVARFWRDGMVPEWINISVHEVREEQTLLEVRVCGRFTAKAELLYHEHEGWPPFHVVSPMLPPRWDEIARPRFDINWHLKRRAAPR